MRLFLGEGVGHGAGVIAGPGALMRHLVAPLPGLTVKVSQSGERASGKEGVANILDSAFDAALLIAAVEIGKFVNDPKPEQALSRMAKFGADITKTFNDRIQSVCGGDALRPLGSVLFIEAALALSGNELGSSQATAMLQLTVVKDAALKADSTFHMTDYLGGCRRRTFA